MESDLLIPLFWTIVFGTLVTLGVKRLSRKLPTEKRWVRPEKDDKDT
tara:strand:- start:87 stop:227 length:141 start_codon:yes stop_codon:yes gene_type:complete